MQIIHTTSPERLLSDRISLLSSVSLCNSALFSEICCLTPTSWVFTAVEEFFKLSNVAKKN